MIHFQAALAQLTPATFPDDGAAAPATGDVAPESLGTVLNRGLTRLAKEQFRASQHSANAIEVAQHTLTELSAREALTREQLAEAQLELRRLREQRRHDALEIVAAVDALDDLLAIARQMGETKWVDRLERLGGRITQALAVAGITEVPALGQPFHEELHEVLASPESAHQPQAVITEVVARGFLLDGKLLRRAQVVLGA